MNDTTTEVKKIEINDSSQLFNTEGMFTREFASDLVQLKYFTHVILQKAPEEIKERNLLARQISELIKNAIIHGNKEDKSKKIKISYGFGTHKAHIIIEDQGNGFQHLEKWNAFYEKRYECFLKHDMDEIEKYRSFRTPESRPADKGLALFDAIQFWNGGIVFNSGRNRVAALKNYPKKNPHYTLR